MDNQTMKDYIEDLLEERTGLYQETLNYQIKIKHLESEVKRLEMELARNA